MIEKFTKQAIDICPSFSIDESQEQYYRNLIYYFIKSDKCEWDLAKGLCIQGNIGTGKTLSIKLCQRIFKGIKITPARHIIREYMVEGAKIIDGYGRESFAKGNHGGSDFTKPINLCIDDLGLEEVNTKFYGNSANVISDILLDRYDTFITYGMLTHATTNLDSANMEKIYGSRVRDRLKEMMNQIVLIGESKRK